MSYEKEDKIVVVAGFSLSLVLWEKLSVEPLLLWWFSIWFRATRPAGDYTSLHWPGVPCWNCCPCEPGGAVS